MIAFPQVQRKAQAELDAVVGRHRLPTFTDAPRIPYLSAVIKEILRWRPVVPLGVPHTSTEDDWYGDMFIPKGTICVPNTWHCNHDRSVFGEDADEFRPEGHLGEEGELLSGRLSAPLLSQSESGLLPSALRRVGMELVAVELWAASTTVVQVGSTRCSFGMFGWYSPGEPRVR